MVMNYIYNKFIYQKCLSLIVNVNVNTIDIIITYKHPAILKYLYSKFSIASYINNNILDVCDD